MDKKNVILSGMRTSGSLHLGHYLGVLKNMVSLQDEFEPYFFVADWHALTDNYADIDIIRRSRIEYVKGWISCGIDVNKTKIYRQSGIPEILYLNQFFQALTPPAWAERSPSWKDLKTNYQSKRDNMGFFAYPVLMATDIAIVNGNFVPAGEDQLVHIEIAREIIRKFNRLYKTNIAEPQGMLTKVPKLLGIDGRKMSSSIGNVITLDETDKKRQKKINKIKSDDTRANIHSPGNPDNCNVYEYQKIFSTKEGCLEINKDCRAGKLGCGECKQRLGALMKEELAPISEKFNSLKDSDCEDILEEQTKKVKLEIQDKWNFLKEKIGF